LLAAATCASLVTAAIGRGRLSGSGAVVLGAMTWAGGAVLVASTLDRPLPARALPLARSGAIVTLGGTAMAALLALRSSPPGDAAQLGASLTVAAVVAQSAANRLPVVPSMAGTWRASAVPVVSVVAIAAAAGAADAIAGGGATERSLIWLALAILAATTAASLVLMRVRG
jgi:hypothetical protein